MQGRRFFLLTAFKDERERGASVHGSDIFTGKLDTAKQAHFSVVASKEGTWFGVSKHPTSWKWRLAYEMGSHSDIVLTGPGGPGGPTSPWKHQRNTVSNHSRYENMVKKGEEKKV